MITRLIYENLGFNGNFKGTMEALSVLKISQEYRGHYSIPDFSITFLSLVNFIKLKGNKILYEFHIIQICTIMQNLLKYKPIKISALQLGISRIR